MDLPSPKFIQSPLVFPSSGEPPLETKASFNGKNKGNPFSDTFNVADPLCKLHLKETSEFVKSFPVLTRNDSVSGSAQRRRENVNPMSTQRRISLDSPSTPGRPVFSFSSVGNLSRKSVPSKWDDAEKWVISHGSATSAPAPHLMKQQQMEVFADKSRVTEEKESKATNVLLKDKFTDEVDPAFPNFRYSEPLQEGFLFRNTSSETMKDKGTEVIREVKHRDIGTEMTPLGSSTTSRCHTPYKSSSPARHNTPADRSGPLTAMEQSKNMIGNTTIDISQIQECHFSKLQFGTQFDSVTTNWSSREEEEEEISKSLRHFETGNECHKSISDARAAGWEEEEKTKCCLRYQREEAKIQAWVNLQSAKAEAQSRKLEVKIQKMRSDLEEKLMKRMAVVHRRAEEWRAAARQQHVEQTQKVNEQAKKIIMKGHINSHISGIRSCGCLPCNN